MSNSYSQDVVLAMVRPSKEEVLVAKRRGYNIKPVSLSRAIMLVGNSCERCLNVLSYRNGLADGYEENSESWKKVNTRCKLCE